MYREELLRLYRRRDSNSGVEVEVSALTIQLDHLGEYSSGLLGHVLHSPAKVTPSFEKAAKDALQTILFQQERAAEGLHDDDSDQEVQLQNFSFQIMFQGRLAPTNLRDIQSSHLNRLVRCPGIIIAASSIQHRATQLVARCTRCQDEQVIEGNSQLYGTIPLPSACHGPDPKECGRHPYAVAPDACTFVNGQTWKLQELPGSVPTGEMPRSVLCSVEGAMVDKAPPGTRLHVWAIPTLMSTRESGASQVYLRVVGIQAEQDAHARQHFTAAEQEAFTALSQRADVYEILQRSLAPQIHGNYTIDIKKALCCQLFGGSSKKLPDGVKLRGDINVLLLGDPSMAKSQFLKFVSKVAPVGIYTSGKGSSAAGLTASVVKDRKGEFYLEGGAMVLADGGIVCIDEFDKMRPTDRVAIHEAMEQQTISVAKAGITTVLHSRSSVLAAANPVFGRYDDTRNASENIDLMTTILSRFDVIFLVRDIREEERDKIICQHVMGVHMDATAASTRDGSSNPFLEDEKQGESDNSSSAVAERVLEIATTGDGELNIPSMKKYVQYCKARCSPRLSSEAAEVLQSSYVKIRDDVRQKAISNAGDSEADTQSVIPITVRQLEALVRLSESLAKMRLDEQVQPADVTEALRLFKVSTMTANEADSQQSSALGGNGNRQEMERTEAFLRSRLTVGGGSYNKQRLVEEAAGQGLNAVLVLRAINIMAGRGEIMERNQGRLLKRVK